jgi:ABC-type transporter Mla subunit MlaD
MRERKQYTDRLVVTFVVLGIVLLAVFSSLVLVNNKVLTEKVYFETVLDNAAGLGRKPPIYFKGLEIGRIDEFQLDFKTNDIRVSFYVYEEYADKIVRYAVISRMGNLLLGAGNEFELLLPRRALVGEFEPLEEGEMVPFVDSELGRAYVSRGDIEVKFDSIDGMLKSVNDVLVNLERVTAAETGEVSIILRKVEQVADSMLVVAKQLEEEQLGAETAKMIDDLNQTILHADEVVADIEVVAAKADEFFVKADDVAVSSLILADTATAGFITANAAFVTANTAFEQTQQTVANTDELIESMEIVIAQASKVLERYDDPVAIIDAASDNKIPGTIDSIDANLAYLQGILKEVYLQREQLAQAIISMNRTLSSFDKTLQGVNNNPLLKDGIEANPKNDIGIEIQ